MNVIKKTEKGQDGAGGGLLRRKKKKVATTYQQKKREIMGSAGKKNIAGPGGGARLGGKQGTGSRGETPTESGEGTEMKTLRGSGED